MQQPVGQGRAAEERHDKAYRTNQARLFPMGPEHDRIELRAGKEGQHDGARAGEKFDPRVIGVQQRDPQGRADDQLRHRSDHDLGQRGGDAQPDRQQRRNQGEPQPQRC